MNTTNFQEWLVNQYHEQAAKYRAALDAEIRHTIVIYGHPLPKDVRTKLLESLKEIELPTLPKYHGIDKDIVIFNKTPKVNFHLIMRDAVSKI